MYHFFDALRVEVVPPGEIVVLSVRVSDTRVDEYRFAATSFREMTEAYRNLPEAWSGPEGLRVRVDTVQRLASLSVLVCPAKREVYRIQQAQFEAMTAQFRSQDGGA